MDNFTYTKDLEEPTDERQEYLKNQVKHLATLPQHIQRSPEWFKFREGLLTASDYGSILGTNKYSRSNSVLKKNVRKIQSFLEDLHVIGGKNMKMLQFKYMKKEIIQKC